jgi:crossover junction endodeoxyribonuclease RuvC
VKILGIDPGITATGYSIINDNECTHLGTIRPGSETAYKKVLYICTHIKELVTKYSPDCAALEKVFHHKNIRTLIRASELRGAIILALLEHQIEIHEYTPTEIKLTTTGNGRASKSQVRYFVERMLPTRHSRISNHAIDAVAIAYTATQKMKRKV